MAKGNSNKIILAVSNDEILFLCSSGGKIVTDRESCSSNSEWEKAITKIFHSHKVSSSAKVIVVLSQGLYSVVQLQKNPNLSEEELKSIAMSRELEASVQGNITDYVWDFYDAKVGKNAKPSANFVLVERKIISSISDIVNGLAKLETITIEDLAMTEFISFYHADSLGKVKDNEKSAYLPQLCLTLFLEKNKELKVFGVYAGELCYSRILRGYKSLATDPIGADDPTLSRLVTEILRINDAFFTARLGLPPMSKLLILMECDQLKNLTMEMSKNFRRAVDVVPLKDDLNNVEGAGFSVCKNVQLRDILKNGIGYAPLLGIFKEGLLVNEKD